MGWVWEGKSVKRCPWQSKRADFEEAARLARPAGSANRIAATVSAEAHAKKAADLSVGGFGAGDEARTRYLHLGKVALYQMSYARGTLVMLADVSRFVKYKNPLILKMSFVNSNCKQAWSLSLYESLRNLLKNFCCLFGAGIVKYLC